MNALLGGAAVEKVTTKDGDYGYRREEQWNDYKTNSGKEWRLDGVKHVAVFDLPLVPEQLDHFGLLFFSTVTDRPADAFDCKFLSARTVGQTMEYAMYWETPKPKDDAE